LFDYDFLIKYYWETLIPNPLQWDLYNEFWKSLFLYIEIATVCKYYKECIHLSIVLSDILNKYTLRLLLWDVVNCDNDSTNLSFPCFRKDDIFKVFRAMTISTVAL
jgi:hypothetical protein